MKKRIVTLVALLMILCLTLVGCGQRGSNINDSSNYATSQNEENTTVNNTDVETEEPTETETETETNPSNSDSGMYTYELHGGITISCKTNVWDYIDGEKFDIQQMALNLGYEVQNIARPSSMVFSKAVGDAYLTIKLGELTDDKWTVLYVFWGADPFTTTFSTYGVRLNTDDEGVYCSYHDGARSKKPLFTEEVAKLAAYAMQSAPDFELNDPFNDILSSSKVDSSFVGWDAEYDLR